jgi:hypothetical protein
MVIQRIKATGLSFNQPGYKVVTKGVSTFPGKYLPDWPTLDGWWVPQNPGFQPIGLFVKVGRLVVAFAVHVSGRSDVASSFYAMCHNAGWFSVSTRRMVLAYLSPHDAVKKQVEHLVENGYYPAVPRRPRRASQQSSEPMLQQIADDASVGSLREDLLPQCSSASTKKRKGCTQALNATPDPPRIRLFAVTSSELNLKGLTWMH